MSMVLATLECILLSPELSHFGFRPKLCFRLLFTGQDYCQGNCENILRQLQGQNQTQMNIYLALTALLSQARLNQLPAWIAITQIEGKGMVGFHVHMECINEVMRIIGASLNEPYTIQQDCIAHACMYACGHIL